MLCQKCKKNQANIHMVKFINGEKSEMWVCEECAQRATKVQLDLVSEDVGKNIQDIFGGLFQGSNVNKPMLIDFDKDIDIICKECGQTYKKYKENKKIHCNKCYESFKDAIVEDLERLYGSSKHIGKIPKGSIMEMEDINKINELKEEINICVLREEYEKAAELRDRINLIKSKQQ